MTKRLSLEQMHDSLFKAEGELRKENESSQIWPPGTCKALECIGQVRMELKAQVDHLEESLKETF